MLGNAGTLLVNRKPPWVSDEDWDKSKGPRDGVVVDARNLPHYEEEVKSIKYTSIYTIPFSYFLHVLV